MSSSLTPSSLKPIFQSWLQALETPAFQDIAQAGALDFSLFSRSYDLASQRILGRLLQALYREALLPLSGPLNEEYDCVIELPVTGGELVVEKVLRLPISSLFLNGRMYVRQPCGIPHTLPVYEPGKLLQLLSANHLLQVDDEQALERLCQECEDSFKNDILSTVYHAHYNHQLTERFGSNWLQYFTSNAPDQENWVLELEEWGTIGHPWHPNYKTKIGLETEDVIGWSPEFRARLPVVFIAVSASCMQVTELNGTEAFKAWFERTFSALHQEWLAALSSKGLAAENYLPVPVHPWQLHHFLQDAFKDHLSDGSIVVEGMPQLQAAPTMSFRTVIPVEGIREQPQIKLPVSLRLTSVERTVSPKSSVMGPRVSGFLQQILARDPQIAQALQIIPERYGLFWNGSRPEADLARHLSVIYRDNPYTVLESGQMAVPVGALWARDSRQLPLLAQWLELRGGDAEQGFDAAQLAALYAEYCRGVIRPTLGAYLKYGIAFEAHQQNSYCIMDAQGRFKRLLLRDFGDIRIHREIFAGHGFSTAQHDPRHTVFDEDKRRFVREKYIHAVLMCHLSELGLLMTRSFGLSVDKVWRIFARVMTEEFEFWKAQTDAAHWQQERRAILEEDWPAKAFIRMRLEDKSEDIVGSTANPLAAWIQAGGAA